MTRVARAAQRRGTPDLLLVSSAGADSESRVFYLRVKGEAERSVGALGFRSVHVLRPSILDGERAERRPAEALGLKLGRLAAPLMVGPLRRHRPIHARTVARALARIGRDPAAGRHTYESERIAVVGGDEFDDASGHGTGTTASG